MLSEPVSARRVARFGVFEADLEAGELRREGRRVALQDLPFQVLAALLQQPGREVSREDLRRRLWPDREFLDFENGINTAVGRLRQVLGDSAENPRFIGTRRGHGYRFIAAVAWTSIETSSPELDRVPSLVEPPLSPARPPALRKAATWRLAAAAIVLIAAAVVVLLTRTGRKTAALHSGRDTGLAGRDSLSIYAPGGQILTGSFALSPSGAHLAFVTGGAEPDESRLWVRWIDGDARPLAGTDGAAMPFWSPDEQHLGFFTRRKLKSIELDSGKITTIADATRGRGGTWNADGVILFAPGVDSPIFSVPASGGPPSPVTDLGDAPSHRFPFFLPDGRHFLYLVLRADRDQSEIRWARLGATDGGRLFAAGSNAVYAADRYVLFARGSSLFAQSFDADNLRPIGLPLVAREHVGVYGEDGPTGLGMFSASLDTLAVAEMARPPLQLTWTDRHGRRLGAVGPPGQYRQVDLSPDGTRAAVVRVDGRRRTSDLSIVDLRNGSESIITDDPWPDSDPVWSPRGDRLAFGSLREGRWSGFVIDPTRPGQEEKLPVCTGVSSWFPDGANMLCPTSGGDMTSFWKVPLDPARAATPLVLGLTYAQARVSPDGSLLAYSSDHEGRGRVYVLALKSGSSRPAALADGVAPRWRRDGRELFFLSGRMLMSTSVSPGSRPEFGEAHPLFEAPLPPSDSLENFSDSFAVWPDGSKFLFAAGSSSEPASTIEVQPRWTPTPAR